jgi:hypothetical protein
MGAGGRFLRPLWTKYRQPNPFADVIAASAPIVARMGIDNEPSRRLWIEDDAKGAVFRGMARGRGRDGIPAAHVAAKRPRP